MENLQTRRDFRDKHKMDTHHFYKNPNIKVFNRYKKEKMMTFLGYDFEKRPVLLMNIRRMFPDEDKINFQRYFISVFEELENMMADGVFMEIVIMDMRDASSGKNYTMNMLRKNIPLLGKFFPDRMYKMYLINTSWTLKMVWYAVSKFLHPLTKAKINVFSSGDNAELFKTLSK